LQERGSFTPATDDELMLGGNYLCAFCPDYSLAISLGLALTLAAQFGKPDPDLALVV
jgi:hypothetical protein